MREDQFPEGNTHLMILTRAIGSAFFREVLVVYNILEHFRVRPICHAQQIVEALRRMAVHVRESLNWQDHIWPLHYGPIGISGTTNQAPRVLFAEQQHHKGGKLIGVVLCVSKRWYLEHTEDSMPKFVGHHIQELSDHGVFWRDAGRRRRLRHVLA